MTEKDLLKYSKPVLAKFIAQRTDFFFRPDSFKREIDRYRREFIAAAINEELDELSARRKGLIAKGDALSVSRYFEITKREDKLFSRLMEL